MCRVVGVALQCFQRVEFGVQHYIACVVDVAEINSNLKGFETRNFGANTFEGRFQFLNVLRAFLLGIATEVPHDDVFNGLHKGSR
ncbi:hypothetical protein D3C78_1587240 [compost metagenome]